MKKIIKTLTIFIFIFLSCSSVIYAKDTIATCKYNGNNDNKNNIIITVYDDYTLYYYSSLYAALNKNIPYTTFSLSLDSSITYNAFMKNDKFDCKNLSTLYLYKAAGGSGRSAWNRYTVSNSKSEEGFDGQTATALLEQYNIDSKNSVVKVGEPDKSQIKSEGWLSICHYGSVTLQFNKEKYEILGNSSSSRYSPDDILEFVKKNKYSCPATLCAKGSASAGNYNAYFYEFSNDFGSNCITSNEYIGNEFKCTLLQNYMDEFDAANNKYFENNNSKDLEDRNKSVEKIKSFCKSITENGNYTDPNKCTKECINMNEVINERLGTKINSGECGLSSNLIKWIKNILKWIKYILPVLVIILGIIDFIKAISSGSDDEMKKAQGRFIKRLIAAALLFLVPALIEFILNVFNIESTFCGLTD